MRIWNVPCYDVSDHHLLGEHRELHWSWSVLTQDKRGYSRHPETLRWAGHLGGLYRRHEEEVAEMARRGWRGHRTPLAVDLVENDSWDAPSVTDEVLDEERRTLAVRPKGWRKGK